MTTTVKSLGQIFPSAATATSLYTVPSATSTIVSTLYACNQGSTTTIRIAHRVGGASLTAAQYIVYDAILNANETFYLTSGLTMGATDILTVYSGNGAVSFNLSGSEFS